jgi:hypothetical protein
MSRRDAAIAGATVAVTAVVMTQILGPRYVDPLPLWAKLALIVVCAGFIGVMAVYSRRRARRI